MKIVQKIQLKSVIFTVVKNRCMLHGRVFVMKPHLNTLECNKILGVYTSFILQTNTGFLGSAVAWFLMPRTYYPEVGIRTPLGSNRVVSLSKAHLLPKSTGNTQQAVAPSQHD